MLRLPTVCVHAALAALAALCSACTHEGFGSAERHFATFSVPEPKGATVHVCHAYGCRARTKFTFASQDLAELNALMARTRGTAPDTPHEERRAVAYAIGWMETRVGNAIGTKDDRAGMDFTGSGDPTQQDCVDEATNTTSYLTVLASAGLLRHHSVGVPFARENYLRGVSGWTHWTAVLIEKPYNPPPLTAGTKGKAGGATPQVAAYVSAPGQKWAVDSWIYANGENPAVVKAEEWYTTSLDDLPKPQR
jgi:hypothetical protein